MERIILALFRVISSAHIKTKRGTEFRGVAAVLVASSVVVSVVALRDSPEHLTQFINFLIR